jgi:hypothetical protein
VVEDRINGFEELEDLSRIVLELATVLAALLETHEAAVAGQGRELVASARDLHHRIQAKAYPG